MSDQNEGLYDSVSAPADQPHQTSSASHGADAAVADETVGSHWAARAAEDEETTALDEVVPDEPAAEDADATQVFELPAEEDEAEPTALLEDPASGGEDGSPDQVQPAAEETVPDEAVDAAAETVTAEPAVTSAEETGSEASERAARARQKAERDRRLGTVAPAAAPAAAPAGKPRTKRTTDKFAGSLGLFFLRVVAAATVGVLGFQIITESGPVISALQGIGVPQADMVSMGVGVLVLVIAVMLLFGLGTRIAAVLLVALAAATLAFFRWGRFNPFIAGQAGFSGDMELLLAGIGLCFLFLGAGGWSIDAGLRRSRARKKARARAAQAKAKG